MASEGGTGIGLALTKEFVQLMNGEIEVQSELGKGTTFNLKIPRLEIISQISTEEAELVLNDSIEGENQITQNLEPVPNNLQSATGKTILLVEDNLDLRNFVKSILEPQYKVVTAENGRVALDILEIGTEKRDPSTQKCLPDLILSDIMMPIMDGYQLLEVLKSTPITSGIPIIMVTARGGMDAKLKALRIGVDDYMLKPFNEKELFARITNLLSNVQNRRIEQPLEQTIQKVDIAPIPTTPVLSKEDQAWLHELEEITNKYLSDFNFNVDALAKEMAISSRQLARRIKVLTGLPAGGYIREARSL